MGLKLVLLRRASLFVYLLARVRSRPPSCSTSHETVLMIPEVLAPTRVVYELDDLSYPDPTPSTSHVDLLVVEVLGACSLP